MGLVLYGLVDAEYRSKTDNSLILSARTYLKGGIEVSASELNIKGGLNNKLLARLFTDGMFAVNAEDALFDFNYVRMAVGSLPTIGGDMIIEPETITITAPNTITVTQTPVPWNGEICGWYKLAGTDDAWQKITFTGKNATVTGLTVGQVVCVQYNVTNAALKVITVPSTIVPEVVWLTMRAALFYASDGSTKPSTRAGTLIIDVPNFQFSPNTTFSFDNGGASTTSLSGTALVDYSGSVGCNNQGQYAYIKEVDLDANWYDTLTGLSVPGGEITMTKTNADLTLQVLGIFSGTLVSPVSNANLTFVSGTPATATVVAGVIHPVAAGGTIISITATDKPEIDCFVKVTVT